MKSSPQQRRSKKPAKRLATRLRAVSDELGVTMPKTARRRSSAGVRQGPRSKPRKVR